MLLFAVIFCVIVALGFGLASAWSDFTGLKISNIYSLSIAAAFVPAFALVTFLAPELEFFETWKSHLIAGGATFAVTFILFSLKYVGAGDSKLGSAFALWIGLPGLPAYLFYMTVMGGVLGIVSLILKKVKPISAPKEGGWVEKAQAGENAVPYGVAITFGAIMAFNHAGYFNPENLIALGEVGF